jgi:hypothetical protein
LTAPVDPMGDLEAWETVDVLKTIAREVAT